MISGSSWYWFLKTKMISLWRRGRRARRIPGVSFLFTLFSICYRILQFVWELPYSSGIIRPRVFPVPVVSVGNLEMGGTGKTPMVRYLAEAFALRGVSPVILSRGYARKGRGETVVSDGSAVLAVYPESGDEPALLSRWLSHVPIVVGRDRVRSGGYALRAFGPQVFLLDDGFSYRRLRKDVEIMMVSGRSRVDDLELFPAGSLRERFSRIRQSDAIVCVGDAGDSGIVGQITKVHPGGVIFPAGYRLLGCRLLSASSGDGSGPGVPTGLFSGVPGETRPQETLSGVRAVGVTGIARPEFFFQLLEAEGVALRKRCVFPDHYPYRKKDVIEIEHQARAAGADLIVTTEKDGIRFRGLLAGDRNSGIRWYEVFATLEVDRGEELLSLVSNRLQDRAPAIFLDRDGTLSEDRGYIVNPEQLSLIEGAQGAVQRINASPYLAVLVSNQSAVGRGMASESRIRSIHLKLEELLASRGAWLDGAYYCPHRPDEECPCRKPETGLIRKAVTEMDIALEGSYMVGDKETDMELAHRLGMRTVLIQPGNGVSGEEKRDPFPAQAGFAARDLSEAVDWILGSHPQRRKSYHGN